MKSAKIPSKMILSVWFLLGLQSFGGGGATLTLIRRAIVEQHAWMSEEEFVHAWAVCQVCPGINLVALTILIGRHIAGGRGIFLCLLGLLFPSVSVTLFLTAFYARFRDSATVKAALRGVIPASVGMGLLTAVNIARAPLLTSHREGTGFLVWGILLILISGATLWVMHPPVVLILFVAGAASAGLYMLQATLQKDAKS